MKIGFLLIISLSSSLSAVCQTAKDLYLDRGISPFTWTSPRKTTLARLDNKLFWDGFSNDSFKTPNHQSYYPFLAVPVGATDLPYGLIFPFKVGVSQFYTGTSLALNDPICIVGGYNVDIDGSLGQLSEPGGGWYTEWNYRDPGNPSVRMAEAYFSWRRPGGGGGEVRPFMFNYDVGTGVIAGSHICMSDSTYGGYLNIGIDTGLAPGGTFTTYYKLGQSTFEMLGNPNEPYNTILQINAGPGKQAALFLGVNGVNTSYGMAANPGAVSMIVNGRGNDGQQGSYFHSTSNNGTPGDNLTVGSGDNSGAIQAQASFPSQECFIATGAPNQSAYHFVARTSGSSAMVWGIDSKGREHYNTATAIGSGTTYNGTPTAISAPMMFVTTSVGNTAFRLPTPSAGLVMYVTNNNSATAALVFGPANCLMNNSQNAGASIARNTTVMFIGMDSTHWFSK